MGDVNLGEHNTRDFDTGGGTELVEIGGIVIPASGGAVTVGGFTETTLTVLGIGGGTAHDAVDAGYPLKIGGKALSALPTAVAANDRVNAYYDLFGIQQVSLRDSAGAAIATGVQYVEDSAIGSFTGQGTLVVGIRDDALSAVTPVQGDAVGLRVGDKGALWVQISDGSGNQITSFGGGTQYVGDAAATATPTGTMGMGLASAAAPTNVSAGNDAVASWHLLNGSQVVNIAAGGTLLTNTGQSAATANFGLLTNGTLTVGVIDETGASAVDALAVGGGTAHDAVDSGNPIKIGGKATTAQTVPTAVANADRVNAWFFPSGEQVVVISDGFGKFPAMTTTFNSDSMASPSSPDAALIVSTWPLIFNGTNWSRQRDIVSLSTAPNVATGIMAAGIGPGFDAKTNPTGVAATSTANAVTVIVNGADTMVFHVTTIGTTPGSMIFETTNDDTNWSTAGFVLKTTSGPDVRIEGSFVPAVNDVYIVRTTGVRQVRYRVNAVYASGTATVKVTASAGVALVKGHDVAPAPHNIGYAETGISAQYTGTQTSTTIGPTISSTQRMVVTSVLIDAGGTVTGNIQVYFGTGAFARGTNKPIYDGGMKPSTTAEPGIYMTKPTGWIGAADEELKVTTSAAINPLTITIWYYLIAA